MHFIDFICFLTIKEQIFESSKTKCRKMLNSKFTMKRIILLFALLFSVLGFSQVITVNTNTYTVPDLVNTVLINSPCDSATNITWKTGTNFGSTNGIGFFQNTNPNFPIPAGVILSTGNVANAPGPNNNDVDLDDGSTAWPGDPDLEATLTAAGLPPMSSANATILEFDFTPKSTNFSFDFLFASEEYGNYQCEFSDAFAFLLTNTVTGVTTNLAVVPGTNAPISVLTIRDFLYNSGCPSVNSQFFGAYNGGISAAASPTSYNGQTKLLNASAVLVPNTLYHIKLVIADRDDYKSDSAIFIASDSFNIGQDVLGPDVTVSSQTAICFGQDHTINSGLNPADYVSFVWKRNGVVLTGENGPSLVVHDAARYELTYQKIGCLAVSDNIKVEYYPEIIPGTPQTLYKCVSSTGSYQYDLSINTPIIKTGMNAATIVTYHGSLPDAESGLRPLSLNYTSNGHETIYARIKSHNNNCYTTKQIDLRTTTPPVANKPSDMTLCARSATLNNGIFQFAPQTLAVLLGQDATINLVSYYTSEANALAGINELGTSYIGTNNTKIFVRVQNAYDSNCYSITDFTLFIKPLPPVDKLANVILCDSYVLPPLVNGNYFTGPDGTGFPMLAGDLIIETQTIHIFNQPDGPGTCAGKSSFKVTILDPLTLSPGNVKACGSYSLPTLIAGNYFDGPDGTGNQLPAGTKITSTQTLYAFYTSVDPFCKIDVSFTVTVNPKIELPVFENVFRCTSYALPVLATGRYFDLPDGNGNELPAGTIITSTQTIYVYAVTPENCASKDDFDVVIGVPSPANISQCPAYELPPLTVGNYFTERAGGGTMIPAGTIIDQPYMKIFIYAPSAEGCMDDISFEIEIQQPQIDKPDPVTTCYSYTLPPLANGDYYYRANGLGGIVLPGTVITSTRAVYVYKRVSATCDNQHRFVVTISPQPTIDSRGNLDVCNSYKLTTLSVGNYYTEPNGGGQLLPGETVLTESQTVYVYARSTFGCESQSHFDVNISIMLADQPANVEECDRYVLPALTVGNYFTHSHDATTPTGGTMLHAGDVITSSQRLYVYTENLLRISCTDENFFDIIINNTPVVAPVSNISVCNSYTLPALAVGNYYTETMKGGTRYNAGDVLTTTQTLFVYAESGTRKNCYDEKSFKVTIFNVDEPDNVTTCESYVLPALTIGKYYTQTNGGGTNLLAGHVIRTTQTIYVYSRSPFSPVCFDEHSFLVTIVDTPVAHAVTAAMTTVCDEDGNNDGITGFNLTTLNATILGSQTGTEFTVTYFANRNDAAANVNPITSTTATTAVARVSNTLTANCFDLRNLTIKVHKLPEPTPVGGIICYDSKAKVVLKSFTIHSGLTTGYTFEWYNEADELVGTGSSYEAVLPGDYYVIATSDITGCPSEEAHVMVNPSEPASIAYSITDDFVDSQVITVIATGVGGDYEYQLDHGPFQDSPVFTNVSSGTHTITVRDKNGCEPSYATALVVNYPKFFTPNGDGFNDTWNIIDLKAQADAKISIFDRQGKFLTFIKPNGAGWDGTFNGRELPSTDYWFVVNYEEDGMSKEFRAHFAMKR